MHRDGQGWEFQMVFLACCILSPARATVNAIFAGAAGTERSFSYGLGRGPPWPDWWQKRSWHSCEEAVRLVACLSKVAVEMFSRRKAHVARLSWSAGLPYGSCVMRMFPEPVSSREFATNRTCYVVSICWLNVLYLLADCS